MLDIKPFLVFAFYFFLQSNVLASYDCKVAGLSNVKVNSELASYSLYIDESGNLRKPDGKALYTGNNETERGEAEDVYIRRLIDNFKISGMKNMTIFVHGGLNSISNFNERVANNYLCMLADGQYPVFVGWNSALFTNYFDHLLFIRQGADQPVRGVLTSPLILLEDAARSIVHFPQAIYKEVWDPITVIPWVASSDEDDYELRIGRLRGAGFEVHHSKPYDGVGKDYITIVNPVKLAFAPFVDGFGTGSWDSMLRRTDLVLSKSNAYEGVIPGKGDSLFSKELTGTRFKEDVIYFDTVVAKFLKRLVNDDNIAGLSINLIGHSMGAIVANNIVARHPRLPIKNLVYMGGAARIKDVEDVVVPWLGSNEHSDSRFYNISIDPYRELGENVYWDFLPRGSLLNWIDFIFGDVNSFKDRTVGSWWNIARTAEDVFPSFVEDNMHSASSRPVTKIRPRVHLTRFSIGGKECGPQKHGAFDEYPFWLESFWNKEMFNSCKAGE